MDNLAYPGLKQFRFYFIIRGIETVELDQAPDGWLATLIEFATSKSYTALRRSLSTPYKFVGNAAFLCRREFMTYFLMADIAIKIDMIQQDLSYSTIYDGRLNFADESVENGETGFIVPLISNDFSNNLDTYDSVDYALDLDDGINLELTPISLNETATFIPSPPTDGKVLSYYWPPMQLINNRQNSIDSSVQSVPYNQLQFPVWNTVIDFFHSRVNQNVLVTGQVSGIYINGAPGGSPITFSLDIRDETGAIVYNIYNVTVAHGDSGTWNATINVSLPVVTGKRWNLYVGSNAAGPANTIGLIIQSGQIDLSYKTITPATVCKALTGDQVFAKLLQKMNPNRNSQPNQPVPYQSFLLNGLLSPLVFTSSDSIRSAKGSIYKSGNTIGQGIYKVVSGPITYQGLVYNTGDQFSFGNDTTFSGVGGIVQKIQSIYVGNIFNVGDSLVAGGTYLVSGLPGESITYAGIVYLVGQFFDYVLGEDTFTVSNDDVFVQQTAEKPQLIISLSDFFKTIKAVMFGNACMGFINGVVFLEDLTMAYQGGTGSIDLGNVSIEWKQSPATDMVFANFKGGYKDQQYDSLNGHQEFNSEVNYTTGLMLNPLPTNVGDLPNALDLQSPVRMDAYGIESVRITQGDTAASRSNNDTFGVWINQTPVSNTPFTYYHPALAADSLRSLTGVDNSVYNFFLSPKSNVLRGAPYLASIFWQMGDYPITVASARKNSGMQYVTLAGKKVKESDPVLPSSLGKPLFIPMYFKGPQNIGYDILRQLDSNPYKDMAFTVNGNKLRGFVHSFKINPATNEKQDITLFLSGSNNLDGLIGY